MTKFETIWRQPSAFVSGSVKSLPKNFIWHGAKFIGHTIVGGLTHTGKVALKLAEEAGRFVWDILEAGITEAEQAENTKIALEKIGTADVEDSVLVGLDSQDLAATQEAAAAA